MSEKKLTLEDLKLESFLTELDETKLKKVQGGYGYGDDHPADGATKDCGNEYTVGCPYNPGGYPVGPSEETKNQACVLDTAQDCTGAQGC